MSGRRVIKKNYIRQYGPVKFRKKDTIDRLLGYLASNGVVQYCSWPGDKTIYVDVSPRQGVMPAIPIYVNSTNFSTI